jgi:lysophospholipase L1-like esterase
MVVRWCNPDARSHSVRAFVTILSLIASLALLVMPGTATAATGDVLRTLVPTPSGSGRAVTFDPATGHLFYTNASDAHIYVIDTSGNSVATLTPVGPNGQPVRYGALSWEPTSTGGVLWGGRYDGSGAVDQINPNTGVVKPMFTFPFPARDSCYTQPSGFIDGLAFDRADGTLWLSDDASRIIEHVMSSGTLIANYPTPRGLCNSGIAVSSGYLFLGLLAGPDTPPYQIGQVAKKDPSKLLKTFSFGFSNGPEGLALDLTTFPGKCVLWSSQFNQTVLRAFEVPFAACKGVPSQPPLVLGLGDSIAAGYGLGPARHYPDNTQAYPYVVAARIGAGVVDYASAGACTQSVQVEPQCSTPTAVPVEQQIIDASNAGIRPTVVTLTVGANDLNFQVCLQNYIEAAVGTPGVQPCSPALINTYLADLTRGLSLDLVSIHQNFQNARILVTGNYNPFPAPVSSYADTCPLYTAIPAAALITQLGVGNGLIALGDAIASGQYYPFVVQVQSLVYNTINGIIGKMNKIISQGVSTIRNAGAVAAYAPLNVTGHDSCAATRGQAQYLLGVKVHLQANLPGGGTLSANSVGPTCPDLDPAIEGTGQLFDIRFAGFVATGSTNCLPHPTSGGQRYIASAVIAALSSTGP